MKLGNWEDLPNGHYWYAFWVTLYASFAYSDYCSNAVPFAIVMELMITGGFITLWAKMWIFEDEFKVQKLLTINNRDLRKDNIQLIAEIARLELKIIHMKDK